MRYQPAEVLAALGERRGVARFFIWMSARDRDTDAISYAGMWNGRGDQTIEVIDGFSGDPEERVFTGTNGLIGIGEITLIADISVRELHVTLSPEAADVIQLLRTYDPKGGEFQLYIGYFDPDTHELIASPRALFVGFIDRTPINLASGQAKADATIVAVSHTRELTRVNPAVRSSEWLTTRAVGDTFYQYTPSISNWELFWGKHSGPLPGKPKGLFGGFFRRLFTGG